jgi:hypothetical protein
MEWIRTMIEGHLFKDCEPGKIRVPKGVSKVTAKAIEQYNSMTPMEFFYKYQCSKTTYKRRVKKYGDPYMKSPLAIIGKLLKKGAS